MELPISSPVVLNDLHRDDSMLVPALPIKASEDLWNGLNAIMRLIPDTARDVGARLMEEHGVWQGTRRMRNIAAATALAVPEMNADATAPDDDWLSEWFDLAGKRSHQDWQDALA